MALRDGPGRRHPASGAAAPATRVAAPADEERADPGEAESPSPDTTGRMEEDTEGGLLEPDAMAGGKVDAGAGVAPGGGERERWTPGPERPPAAGWGRERWGRELGNNWWRRSRG